MKKAIPLIISLAVLFSPLLMAVENDLGPAPSKADIKTGTYSQTPASKITLFQKWALKWFQKKAKKKKSGWAYLSLFFLLIAGLVSLEGSAVAAWIAAAVFAGGAIVSAMIALRKRKRDPEQYGGKGIAIASIILGFVFFGVSAVIGFLKALET